jgi:hypothetical protein
MITLKHVAKFCEGRLPRPWKRVSRLMKSPSPLGYMLQNLPLSNLQGPQYNTRAFATPDLPVVYNLKDDA